MAKQEASANLETAQILRDMTKEFAFSTPASPFGKADVDVLEELMKSPGKITDKRRRRRNKDYAQTESKAQTQLDMNLAQQQQLLQQQNAIRNQYVSANAASLLPASASTALMPAGGGQEIQLQLHKAAIKRKESEPELITKETTPITVLATPIQLELEKNDVVALLERKTEAV